MRRVAPLLLGLLALPATTFAQEEEPQPAVQYADETVLTEEVFRDLHIESMVVGPPDTQIQVRTEAAKFAVLFRLRMNFDDEMSESIDLIR